MTDRLKINNHILEGEKVSFLDMSIKNSGLFRELDTITLHYTATHNVESVTNTFTDPKVKACAHCVIDRDGKIIQFVPFNLITWHAGISSYGKRKGYNKYSIGVEMVNVGPVTEHNGLYKSWYGSIISPYDVISATHTNESVERYWQTYTPEQIQAVRDLCGILIDVYDIKYILGHDEISVGRKTDPGPAFPSDKIRNSFFNINRMIDVEKDISVGMSFWNKLKYISKSPVIFKGIK